MTTPLLQIKCTLSDDMKTFRLEPIWREKYLRNFKIPMPDHMGLHLLGDTIFPGECEYMTSVSRLVLRLQTESHVGRGTLILPVEAKPYLDYFIKVFNFFDGNTEELALAIQRGLLATPKELVS